ncbi:hydrolase [Aeromicrobium sp. A1-2]|uniref:serine aminopeptidase domain-containing protein n=1 Tax=Aeromicrobium sp. A1-2 TaxID=2107713 RepID=UPI000E5483BB|nr:alpha/beta hydrolase [Aeromicrobium sp. A1-2]AXT84983.1 hydrolase [Aeromicrobium sp. A1-2]
MPAPLVLISAAMAVPSGFYRTLVADFHDRGWDAKALPNRGFERGEPIASRSYDWSYADEMAAIAAEVALARAEQPDRPVILLGHSLGSQIGAGHELHHPPSDGFVTVGASAPYFRAYPRGGLPVLFMGTCVPLVTRLLGYLPKPFFGAPGARTLMREWARFIRTGKPPFEVAHPITTPSLVVQLQGDAYSVSAANKLFVETFLDPASTTRWVYTKAAAPDGGTTDHVLWARTPGPVVDQIIAWWPPPTPR